MTTIEKPESLYSYDNGNYIVSIYEDGTKERECQIEGELIPENPESLDVKITNYCDQADICTYCHEKSNKQGKNGDIEFGLKLLCDLPSGVEIAIGGGNPLDHPHLITFLWGLRELGLIANLTVNSRHISEYNRFINKLIKEKLIRGLGVSWTENNNNHPRYYIYDRKNIVYHLIVGIDTPFILEQLIDQGGNNPVKVLLLGFKTYGNGSKYKEHSNNKVDNNIEEWKRRLPNFVKNIGNNIISFDNLAIRQLNIKSYFTEEGWNKFYMGDDGKYSMYLDLVNKKYAKSSTSLERFDIPLLTSDCNVNSLHRTYRDDVTIRQIFKYIRSL